MKTIITRADCKAFADEITQETRIPDFKNKRYLYVFSRTEQGKLLFAHIRCEDAEKDCKLYETDCNTIWRIRKSINHWIRAAA